jgi:hypothetical protein
LPGRPQIARRPSTRCSPADADAAPILILALRFTPAGYDTRLVDALRKLTGANPGNDWAAWMLWQEAHPEIGVLPDDLVCGVAINSDVRAYPLC